MSASIMERTTSQLTLRQGRAELFAPFGTLVEMGEPVTSVNEGTALRHDIDAFAAATAPRGFHLVTSLFSAEPQALPRAIRLMERHRNSPQLIMPVACEAHAVIVGLDGADGDPDPATLRAFWLTRRQGIIYRRGIWHHPILAWRKRAEFLVQSWQDGTADDCDIVAIAPVLLVHATGDGLEEER